MGKLFFLMVLLAHVTVLVDVSHKVSNSKYHCDMNFNRQEIDGIYNSREFTEYYVLSYIYWQTVEFLFQMAPLPRAKVVQNLSYSRL